mmetsp:Transcript_6957/g.9335  ORF Transcript_6957/g.9335 Transcript_6957/m.9335 type:complete len:215 (+) Transcript_6957:285-929(+)
MSGSGGPSRTDADQWRSFLLRFGSASLRLREAVASSIRQNANSIVEWDSIRALVAKRGLALDKSPGVRPLGIGETLQRIQAKVIAHSTKDEIQDACGVDNLCGGIKGGIEGGIHAVREIFEDDETEGGLLVDAGNAFNVLAREATLWNCRIMWPSGSRFVFDTYRGYARIFINGTDEIILSKEGCTQGDKETHWLCLCMVLVLFHFHVKSKELM